MPHNAKRIGKGTPPQAAIDSTPTCFRSNATPRPLCPQQVQPTAPTPPADLRASACDSALRIVFARHQSCNHMHPYIHLPLRDFSSKDAAKAQAPLSILYGFRRSTLDLRWFWLDYVGLFGNVAWSRARLKTGQSN